MTSKSSPELLKTKKAVIIICLITFSALLFPINTIKSSPFMGPLISEDNIVSVTYTQEDLAGSIRWDSFLEDINEEGKYLDFVIGSFDEISLRMEMDFVSGSFTGSLNGNAIYDFPSMKNHLSFNGEFTGVIDKYNWNYNSWFWEFGSNFTLSLTCSKEQFYTNEQNEASWNTREETIQVVAELTGDTFAGQGGIGSLDVTWEDPGLGADDSREFTIYNKNDLSADLPDVIDINAEIRGPEIISNTDSSVTFDIDASGVDLELVEEVSWYFYNYDDIYYMGYRWFETFTKSDFSSLTLNNEKILEWVSYVNDYGKTVNNERKLPMQVVIQVMTGEDEWLFDSEEFNFTYVIKETPVLDLIIDKKVLDVYPTCNNETFVWLELGSTDLSDNITFEISETLPEYLKIEFDKRSVSGPFSESIINKLRASLDMTKTSGQTLPSEYTVTVMAKSKKGPENIESSKQLTLQLKSIDWTILHYISEQTEPYPILQGYDEKNINDIINAFNEKKNPQVGYILFIDLAKSTLISGLELNKGAHLMRLYDGKLEKIESSTVNMANPNTLKSFIEKSLEIYPSEKTNLIITDHGRGIQGVAIEGKIGDTEDSVDFLSPSEIKTAINNKHLDFIAFETCLTSNIEVFYELRECADYIIASQETMSGSGFSYEKIIPRLLSNSDMTTVEYANTFTDAYTNAYKLITLSLVKTSSLEELKNQVDSLAKEIRKEYSENESTFHKEIVKTYKMVTTIDEGHSIDLFDFCQNIQLNDFSQTIKQKAQSILNLKNSIVLKNVVNNSRPKTVLANRGLIPEPNEEPVDVLEEPVTSFKKETKTSSYNGISIWFWGSGLDNDAYKIQKPLFDLTDFGKNTAWKGFVEDYMNGKSEPKVIVTVDQHEKNLFARVVDDEGHIIGYDPDSLSRNKVEMDYSDVVYYRYLDGTTEFILPAGLANMTVIVDGGSMEEDEETYTLDLKVIYDDSILFEDTQDVSISVHNEHAIPVSLDNDDITLGEIEITDKSPPSDPEPDPEPEPSGGIPGFPVESLVLSIVLASVLMWTLRKRPSHMHTTRARPGYSVT